MGKIINFREQRCIARAERALAQFEEEVHKWKPTLEELDAIPIAYPPSLQKVWDEMAACIDALNEVDSTRKLRDAFVDRCTDINNTIGRPRRTTPRSGGL